MDKSNFTKKLFSWHTRNPLKTWWKARKYFQFPTIRFYFGPWGKCSTPPIWLGNVARILDVFSMDLMWKDKFDSPRQEMNPCISIVFFRRWKLAIWFTKAYKGQDYQTQYWESILDFLYYGYDWSPVMAARNNIWTSHKTKENTPTEEFSLKKSSAYSEYTVFYYRGEDGEEKEYTIFHVKGKRDKAREYVEKYYLPEDKEFTLIAEEGGEYF